MIRRGVAVLLSTAVFMLPFARGFAGEEDGSLPMTFKGRTLTADSKPVAGLVVKVRLLHSENDAWKASTTTDVSGAFAIDMPPEKDGYSLAVMDASGHVYAGFAHLFKTRDFGDLTVRKDCSLTGKILDKDGAPLAGARMSAAIELVSTCRHYQPTAKATTDADGAFEINDLSPGKYECTATADMCEPQENKMEVGDDIAYCEFRLKPGCKVSGVVTGPDGKPLSGVTVEGPNESKSVTGEDGRYSLASMPAGRESLDVSTEGKKYVAARGRNLSVTCNVDKPATLDIAMVKSGNLAIKFNPVEAGATLPTEASISLMDVKPARGMSYQNSDGKADADGVLQFEGLAPGKFKLQFSGDELQQLSADVELKAGETVTQEVALARTYQVSGVIVDEKGAPVPDADAGLESVGRPDGMLGGRISRGMSTRYVSVDDKTGKFQISGVSTGEHSITVRAPGFAETKQAISVATNDLTDVKVIVAEGLCIGGTVLGADGAPVVGASVSANLAPSALRMGGRFKDMSADTTTDAEGRFLLRGLTNSRFSVSVSSREGTYEELATLNDVAAGVTDLFVSVAAVITVNGAVVGPDGSPVAGADIAFQQTESTRGLMYFSVNRDDEDRNVSDKNGAFSVKLREGNLYQVAASSKGLATGTALVDLRPGKTAPDQPIKIALGKTCTVSGSVVRGADKLPVSGATVRWDPEESAHFNFGGSGEEEGKNQRIATTDGAGLFQLADVPPGKTRFSVVKKRTDETGEETFSGEQVVASERLVVKRDQTNTVTITMPDMGSVSGKVLSSDGTPLAGAHVSLSSMGRGGIGMQCQADDKGAFSLAEVPAGQYMLMSYSQDETDGDEEEYMTPKMTTITVSVGTNTEVTLGLPDEAGKAVSGEVLVAGKPVPAGMLMLTRATTNRMEMMMGGGMKRTSIKDGRFSLKNVSPGEYFYTIMPGDAETAASGLGGMLAGKVSIDKDSTNVEIRVEGVTVSGKVLDASGAPMPEVMVMLYTAGMTDWTAAMEGSAVSRTAQTTADGSYRIECVPPGEYEMRFQSQAAMSAKKLVSVSNVDLAVDLAPAPSVSLSGKVTAAEGIENVMIYAFDMNDPMNQHYQNVEEDGTFNFTPQVPKSRYQVLAFGEDGTVEGGEMDLQKDTVLNFTIVRGGNAAVQLTSADGKAAVSGRTVRAFAADGTQAVRVWNKQWAMMGDMEAMEQAELPAYMQPPTDAAGKTRIGGLKPGKYTIKVDDSKATGEATVVEGQTAEVKIAL